MSKEIENSPSPSILMNSMRSIGYSFKTALADIIDNSISANAKNIFITVPINDNDLYITILDDGKGMTRDELFNAMKYGSSKEYSPKDLGRFGLGLKSASLSQCRELTVVSKLNNNIAAFQWDLDIVLKNGKWNCIELDINEINDLPNYNSLCNFENGTLVIWQNFDTAYKKNEGKVREYLSENMEDAELYLRLVFHRFLSNRFNPLSIYVNGNKLEYIDPFLEDNPKTDSKRASEISIRNEIIKVQPYILPHQNDLTNDDIQKLGGIDLLRSGQGFYIYRSDRLIIYGTWFKLSTSTASSELLKYGRIKVDIPNSLDDIWEIDVKKQNATIPKSILNSLKKTVYDVSTRSKAKSEKRARLTLDKDDSRIWNKSLSRDKKDIYSINKDSKFVSNFLDEFDDKDKSKILNFLDIISATIPYDDLYNSICNKKNETNLEEEQLKTIIVEGLAQFRRLKELLKRSDEDIFNILIKYEPFNNEKVIENIKEIIFNEK